MYKLLDREISVKVDRFKQVQTIIVRALIYPDVIVFATCNRGSKKSSIHSEIHARPILNWKTWLVREGLSRARYPAVRFFAFHLSKVSDLTLAFKQWLPERLWEHEIYSCLYFEFNFLQILNVNKCFIFYNVI